MIGRGLPAKIGVFDDRTGLWCRLERAFEDDAFRMHRAGMAIAECRVKRFDENLAGELPLAVIASECSLSLSQFSRAFRKSLGGPPH
jgi:AraC-like DNA-binding protein